MSTERIITTVFHWSHLVPKFSFFYSKSFSCESILPKQISSNYGVLRTNWLTVENLINCKSNKICFRTSSLSLQTTGRLERINRLSPASLLGFLAYEIQNILLRGKNRDSSGYFSIPSNFRGTSVINCQIWNG